MKPQARLKRIPPIIFFALLLAPSYPGEAPALDGAATLVFSSNVLGEIEPCGT